MGRIKSKIFSLLGIVLIFSLYFNYWRIAYYIDKEYYFHEFPYYEFKDKKIGELINRLKLPLNDITAYMNDENFVQNGMITFNYVNIYFEEINKGSILSIYFKEEFKINYYDRSGIDSIQIIESKILKEYSGYTIEAISVHKDYYVDKYYTDKLEYQRNPY